MALKDNICTEGIATTCCSDILRGHVPCYSAVAWQKLQASAQCCSARPTWMNLPWAHPRKTSRFGAPKNPIDPAFVAGGSSGGSAAAVAADLAVYALGSDTGGSVRQPASFCGVVGFRPTYGSVSAMVSSPTLVARPDRTHRPLCRRRSPRIQSNTRRRADTVGADSNDEISPMSMCVRLRSVLSKS